MRLGADTPAASAPAAWRANVAGVIASRWTPRRRSRTNPGQEDTLSRTHVCRGFLGRVAGLLLAGVLAACGAAPSGQAGGPDAGTAAVAATPATPAATARGRPPATPGGSIAVDIDVTPGYVAVRARTLSLPPQFYYGNNVKFPQLGVYQVFIRTQRIPLLGKEAPPAAQFTLAMR